MRSMSCTKLAIETSSGPSPRATIASNSRLGRAAAGSGPAAKSSPEPLESSITSGCSAVCPSASNRSNKSSAIAWTPTRCKRNVAECSAASQSRSGCNTVCWKCRRASLGTCARSVWGARAGCRACKRNMQEIMGMVGKSRTSQFGSVPNGQDKDPVDKFRPRCWEKTEDQCWGYGAECFVKYQVCLLFGVIAQTIGPKSRFL